MPSRAVLCLISVILICGTVSVGASDSLKPVMDAAGKISFGSKSIWMKDGHSQLDMVIDGSVGVFGTSIFNFGQGDTSPCFFLNKKVEINENSITCVSDMTPGRGEKEFVGRYSISLSLCKDDLVKISISYTLNPGVTLGNDYFYMDCHRKLDGYYIYEGKRIELDPKRLLKLDAAKGLEFTFFPGNPARKFRIIPKVYSRAGVNPEKGMMSFVPLDGKLELLLDMSGEKEFSRSPEYYGGTDFEKIDKLHLPQYGFCRNLIQNPSFEAGMRFYGHKSFGGFSPFENSDAYAIDDQNAVFGKNSLRIRAFKDTNTLQLATFAIPLDVGKKYVLSFYAKGSFPEGLTLRIDGRATVTYWLFEDKKLRAVNITDKWKRYELSFTPIEEFYSIYFQGVLAAVSKEKEGTIWLDGLQLEEEKLTDYTEVPFSMQLTSASRGNFLSFGQKPDFKLILKAKPEQSGSLELAVEDFFYKKIFEKKYEFSTGKDSETVIGLQDLDKAVLEGLARGVFSVKALLRFTGGKDVYRDYFRFSVMTPLEAKHKNRNIFCISPESCNALGADGVDRRMSRFRDAGFGSAVYTHSDEREIEKLRIEKLEEYGFAQMGRPVINKWTGGGIIREDGMAMTNLKEVMVNASPEKLKEYEAICEAMARNRPWISTWFFAGEIEGMKPLVTDPVSLGKVIVSTLKGIKKGNPNAKVHMGGTPWNINESGREWADKYIKAVTEADPDVKFDGTAIHVYQEMPERPDFDAAASAYIEVLKRYGYDDKPIYWDEGMNYFEYFIPGKGMTPYHGNSGDKWYPGMLTYDMGRSERIAAAFSARSWLVALKYMKNVACLLDWSMRRYFWDYDFTIGAKIKVVNTICRILGDADFYKDIRFAPDCRCYMFIDREKRPVAVIWGYDQDVDRWEKEPPVFRFNFGGLKLEFLDLMETKRTFPVSDGFTRIPMSPFPIFIRGEAGTEVLLAQSIADGKDVNGARLPVKVCAMPLGAEKAELGFANELSVPLNAEAGIILGSVHENRRLALSPNGTAAESVTMSRTADVLKSFKCSVELNSENFMEKRVVIDGAFTFIPSVREISVDGREDDWKDIAPVTLAPGVELRMATDGKNLCFSLKTDSAHEGSDVAVLVDAVPNPGTWAEFRAKEQDIYIYEIVKGNEGAPAAFCNYVPSVQADSGPWTPKPKRFDPRIAVRREKSSSGEFIEMAFPAVTLMPLNLVKGEKLGINIVLKKGESLLSLAPMKGYHGAKDPGAFKTVLGFVE